MLPKRTADTMSDAIALSSPSGRMSKRSRQQAMKRLSIALFGPEGLQKEPLKQNKKESLLRSAADLREIAARGMSTRSFIRAAIKLEAEASGLSSSN